MPISRGWVKAFCMAILIALLAAESAPAQRRGGRKASRKPVAGKRAGKAKTSRITRARRRGRAVRRDRHASRRRRATRVDADAPRVISYGIPAERVTEIQKALIRHGFLEGEPTGQYDENTVEAMKRFQAAHQLPVTGQPSAHTLKRLGVSKTSNDGYSVPVRSASVGDSR